MNRLYFQGLVSILILMIAIPVQAQPLWGETTSGMSPSQVITAVKGSRLIQDGSSLAGELEKELVRLDDLSVVNESFKVRFYFFEDKLTQVTLNLNDEKSYSQALPVLDLLIDTLRSEYGKEVTRDVGNGPILEHSEATWVNGKTNISVIVLAVGDNSVVFNVNYQTGSLTDAEEPRSDADIDDPMNHFRDHEPVKDDVLGVTFPERIGMFALQGREEFQEPGMGYSLRYHDEHLFKVNVYVYDNDLTDIGNGIDSKRVTEEFASVLSVFSIFEKMGKYKDVKRVDKGTTEYPHGSLQFLWSRCQYRQSAGEGVAYLGLRVSETYLSAKSGKFVKVRLTLKEEELNERQAEISGFMKHIGRILGSQHDDAK